MALVIPADYAQCAFLFEYLEGGGTAVVTMGMDFRGYTGTRAGGIDAVAGAWQTNILPGQSTVIRYLGVTARWGVLNSEPVVVSAPRAVVGANAGSMLTRNTALLVKKRTNRGGRRGRGRMYVPGRRGTTAGLSVEGQFLLDRIAVDPLHHDRSKGHCCLLALDVVPEEASSRLRLVSRAVADVRAYSAVVDRAIEVHRQHGCVHTCSVG